MELKNIRMRIPPDIFINASGIRGRNPGSFTPKLAAGLVSCYVKVNGGSKYILSRDSRATGIKIKEAIVNKLLSAGINIFDADLIPLPTTQLAIINSGADGGIDITASHNPIEWNGLKLFDQRGIYIDDQQVENIKNEYTHIQKDRTANNGKIFDINQKATDDHIERVLKKAIRGRKLTVAADTVNGAGSIIVPRLLEKLDCKVIQIATNPNQPFPHDPEPNPNNLRWTQNKLRDNKFDICFVVDPDADRLALIDEKGNILSEELTLALSCLEYTYQARIKTVVTNICTSRIIDDLSAQYGFRVVRIPVGELNVVNEMQKNQAEFGGEGNGGVIDPELHYGRDALVGIVAVINLIRRTGKSIDDLAINLPQYYILKDKITIGKINLQDIYQSIIYHFPDAIINQIDGLRIDFKKDKSWVSIRPSNTEPILRIIAEAPNQAKTRQLIRQIKKIIGGRERS